MSDRRGSAASPVGTVSVGVDVPVEEFLAGNLFTGGAVCLVRAVDGTHLLLIQHGQYVELVRHDGKGARSNHAALLSIGLNTDAQARLHGTSGEGFVLFDETSLAELREIVSGTPDVVRQRAGFSKDGQTIKLQLTDGREIRWFARSETLLTEVMLQQLQLALGLVSDFIAQTSDRTLSIQRHPAHEDSGPE